MKVNKQIVRKIIIEEARNLHALLEVAGTDKTVWTAATKLLETHAGEISADPYGFADAFETAAELIRDKERGPTRE